jgi:kynurenine 3-monooxygenase
MSKKIVIIGAGMAGCFLAICLGKRGYKVEVYEQLPDVRTQPLHSGRSYNMTLYYKALTAMGKMGVLEEVRKIAVIAEGNVPHYPDRIPLFDPFDKKGKEVLLTAHRNHLNGVLISLAEKLPNVTFTFNTECISINRAKKKLYFEKEAKQLFTARYDILVGADGVNSTVRAKLQHGQPAQHVQQYEDWGYKEVHIPKEVAEKLALRENATHTWPRDNSLLLAFPNPDKTLNLMFNLPLKGHESFESLNTEEKITYFIKTNFPELDELLPYIIESILSKPTGYFVTILTNPWYYHDSMVLIGDAAHGVTPFYGQGVSAAFDDGVLLADLIDANAENLEKAFYAYQHSRKENTDVLAYLSKENFVELRDRSRSSYHLLKAKVNTLFHQVAPTLWLPPLYYLVAHDTVPYKEAYEMHLKQEKIAKRTGLNAVIAAGAIPFNILRKVNKSTRG